MSIGETEDQVVACYSQEMSTQEISDQIEGFYDVELSASAVLEITDRILVNNLQWQSRSLEAVYTFVSFDTIRYPVRDDAHVTRKVVYSCLAVTVDGGKALLGLWIDDAERATFCHVVITELWNRGDY